MTTNRIKVDRAARTRLMGDKGPSTQNTTGRWVDWGNAEDLLGQPFDNTRLPFSKLYQMRRDPMIAFGLLFAKLPLVRAPWYMKCEDARIASFADNALRSIYGRFIFQYANCLDFGFSPMEKRFESVRPLWKYEKGNQTFDVWDAKVDALVWKSFRPLKPDLCEPCWSDDGEFNGIIFRTPDDGRIDFAKGMIGQSSRNDKTTPDIPLEKALWATNEKDSVFDSLWGFPRVAYAYRYWWSYWYRWALADRHFEKDSDPPAIVYFPSSGDFDEDGNEIDNQFVALELGDNARSGSTIALPSEVIMGMDDKPTNVRRWGIEFLQGGGNFSAFENTFAYLDVAKLRAVMVPEQAFLEGQGGTSSRNVAETLSDVFFASQAVLMQEIDYHINRFMLPQLIQANFGNGAPKVEKVTRGFASQDIELSKAIVQLFGQSDPTSLEVDMREILTQMGIPLLTPGEVEKEKARAAREAKASQPPQTPSFNGYAGVNQWGMYEQPRELIALSSGDGEKIELADWLPDTPHFADEEIKRMAQSFRDEWVSIYEGIYNAYATAIGQVDDEVSLSEDTLLLLARSEDEAIAYADKFLDEWVMSPEEKEKQIRRVAGWMRSVMETAGKTEIGRMRMSDVKWDADHPDVVEWSRKNAAKLVKVAGETTKRELRKFISAKLAEPGWDWKQIAGEIREKFPRKWPGWKADRVARTETMRAYNAASLLAYEQNGVTHVRAHDAAIPERSDPHCISRDGKIFPLADAWKEQDQEHPNGTLSWSPLPLLVPASVTFSEHDDLRYKGQPTSAYIDKETYEIHFDSGISEDEMSEFLVALSDRLDLGSFATLKRAWDEERVRRSSDGRFTFKPGALTDAEAKKALYTKRRKAIEARISKKVEKGTTKAPVPEVKGGGYKSGSARNSAGKINQKALLAYAEMASSSTHIDSRGNVILDTSTTVAKYRMGFTKNGEPIYSKSRQEVHERIIDAFLRRRSDGTPNGPLDVTGDYLPSQSHPEVLFTGGGYSAGKGGLVDRVFPKQGRIPKDSFTLDPNVVKSALPEYRHLIETDPEANLVLYEEAWDISQEIQRRGQEKNINMIVDGISDTSADEVIGRVQSFADAGYEKLDLVYVDVSTDEAMARAKKRAENPKSKLSDRRFIPEVIMRAVHRDVAATMDDLFRKMESGQVRVGVPVSLEVYDNEHFPDPSGSGFSVPTLVAKASSDGKVEIPEPGFFAMTLSKKNESIPGVSEVVKKAPPSGEKVSSRQQSTPSSPDLAPAVSTGGPVDKLGDWAKKWSKLLPHLLDNPALRKVATESPDLVRAIVGMSEQDVDLLPSECVQELDQLLFAERGE